jgi:hypothetical protein
VHSPLRIRQVYKAFRPAKTIPCMIGSCSPRGVALYRHGGENAPLSMQTSRTSPLSSANAAAALFFDAQVASGYLTPSRRIRYDTFF